MPAELASDGVGDGGGKLSPQAEVHAELAGKGLGAVERVGQVPLKLVHQGDVAHVNVELEEGERTGDIGGLYNVHCTCSTSKCGLQPLLLCCARSAV